MSDVLFVAALTLMFGLLRWAWFSHSQVAKNYFNDGPFGDAAAYFVQAQFFREHRCGEVDPRCLIGKDPVYLPHLFESLSACLPDSVLEKRSWIPNCILLVCFLFILGLLLIQEFPDAPVYAVSIVMLVSFCDKDVWSFSRDRVHFISFQPRLLGALLLSLYWIGYIFSTDLEVGLALVSLALVGFLLQSVSVFSRQAYFLTSIFYGLITLSFMPVVCWAASLFCYIAAFRQNALKDITNQLAYHGWYWGQFERFFKVDLKEVGFFRYIFVGQVKGGICYLDSLLLAGYLGLASSHVLAPSLVSLVIMLFLIYFLTSIRRFAFLGESWRYLAFGLKAFPAAALIIIFNEHGFNWFVVAAGACVVFNLAVIFCEFCFREKVKNSNSQLFDIVDGVDCELEILYCVSFSSGLPLLYKGLCKKTFWFQAGNNSNAVMNEYFESYPYLKWNRSFLLSHGVTHVLVNKSELEAALPYGFDVYGLHVISENDDFLLYSYT